MSCYNGNPAPAATPALTWHRTSEGLEATHPLTGGVYALQRHHVDDREFDGGYVWTYWNVLVDDEPWEQRSSQHSARRAAEDWAHARLVREAREGRVFVRSAPPGRFRGRCELVLVDPEHACGGCRRRGVHTAGRGAPRPADGS